MRPYSLTPTPASRRVCPLGPLGLTVCGAARLASMLVAGACAPALQLARVDDDAMGPSFTAQSAPAAVHGCWVGTYAAPSFARRGQAALAFTGPRAGAAADGTAGWLTITDAARPAAATPAGGAVGGPCDAPAAVGAVRVPLRAVAAEAGEVVVQSEPYWDANCGCTLTLTLTARQAGDTLAGAFAARGAATMAAESRGRWRVVRVAAGPRTAAPLAARATGRPPGRETTP